MNRAFERVKLLSAALLATFLMAWPVAPALAGDGERIVAIGGSVTEIVYLLGEEDRLIARDTTSNYPPEASELTDVGYIRGLSPEGVLSVGPDMILSLEGAGPPETIALLKQAGVEFIEIADGSTGESIVAKIRSIGSVLEVEDKAEALAASVSERLQAVERLSQALQDRVRVLFILAVQDGRILAAGADTQAGGIIAMAGGVNVIDAFTGYKQVSDEAVISAQPEAILVMQRGGDFGTQRDQLLAHPAIAATPAGKDGRIISMDGMYLLGFGPRTAEAAQDLHHELYDADEGG